MLVLFLLVSTLLPLAIAELLRRGLHRSVGGKLGLLGLSVFFGFLVYHAFIVVIPALVVVFVIQMFRKSPVWGFWSLLLPVGLLIAIMILAHQAENPTKSREADAKGKLGALRSAIEMYSYEKKGTYPEALDRLTSKFVVPISSITSGGHPSTNRLEYVSELISNDNGGWMYVNDPTSKDFGSIMINCTHKDSKGRPFSSF